MASAIFSRYAWGIETTRGTAVAATRLVGAAPKAVPNDRVWKMLKYNSTFRTQYSHYTNDELFVKDSLTFDADHPLYFQALPMLFQCSLDGTITPAEQTGGQGDYKWDVTPSMTAANAPDTFTLEMGDDQQAYEIEFCMVDNLKFAWTIAPDGSASPVTGEFGYFGRQVTETTFTSSMVLPATLETLNGKLSRLYANASWATIGNTEIASTLRGAELEIMTGNEPKFFGSANKYFSTYGEGMIGTLLTLDLEGNASADAFFDSYQAGDKLGIRVDINGAQIGSGVTSLLRFDMMMAVTSVTPLNTVVGSNNLHRAVLTGVPDVSGNFLDIDLITTINTP